MPLIGHIWEQEEETDDDMHEDNAGGDESTTLPRYNLSSLRFFLSFLFN